MSLQKQLVHLNMTGGLQTKDDSFLVIPSKLTVADNVEFDDESTAKVRGGLTNLPVTGLSVLEALSNVRRVITHNDQLVLEADSGNYRVTDGGLVQIYPIDSSNTRGARVFPRASMVTRREGAMLTTISANPYPATPGDMDTAVIGSKQFIAWETRDPSSNLTTIRFQIQDVLSGKVLREGLLNTLLTKVRSRPRVIAYDSEFVLYFAIYTAGSTQFEIRRIAWSAATGAVSKAEASIVTSSAAGVPVESDDRRAVSFDVSVINEDPNLDVVGLVFRDIDAPATVRLRALSVTDYSTVIRSRNVVPAAIPDSVTALVNFSTTPEPLLHAFYGTGANTIVATGLNVLTGAAIATTTVGTAAVGSVTKRATAYAEGSVIYLAWDAATGLGEQSTLRVSKFDSAYGSLQECAAFAPWFIAGRTAFDGRRRYLPMLHSASASVVDSTLFIIDFTSVIRNIGISGNNEPPHVLARIDPGEIPLFLSSWRAHNRVPSLSNFSATSALGVIETGLVYCYPKFEADYVVVGTSNNTATCASTAVITQSDASYGAAAQLGQVEVNGITLLAGACPMLFDGTSMVEEGFHHAPWNFYTATPAAAGTYGPFPAGDVTFCFTLGWQDDKGNWHESAPSNETTLTFSAAAPYCSPVLVLPPTQKKGTVLRMYRTVSSVYGPDTSLYLATDTSGVFVGTDADLVNGEQLYTAGGVLPNTPAPSCRHATVFQRRVVLSGCGDGSRVHWSKQFDVGYGVEFSAGDPSHFTTVPASAGRAVATAEMDDRLVILCEKGVGIISGTGPSSTGTQGQYSEFSTIITETGCFWYAPRSVARGPEGVWFRSPFGIRLVSRSGSLARGQDGKQLGAEVDGQVVGNCVAVVSNKQQIQFHQIGISKSVLVWDYQWLQWTRFIGTYIDFVDAASADNRHYIVTNSAVRYFSETSSSDLGLADVVGAIETSWLALAGLQGYQRVYRLMVLGKEISGNLGNATIGVQFYYDYSASGPSGGGTATVICQGEKYQLQHHFAQQKCEALKIKLTMNCSDGISRIRLTDLTLQVGVKTGYNKLPSSARF